MDTVSTMEVDGSGATANATVDVFSNIDGDSDCVFSVGSTTADGSVDWTLGGLSRTTGEYALAVQTDTSGNSSEVSTDVIVP